jgi:hypothetical protein
MMKRPGHLRRAIVAFFLVVSATIVAAPAASAASWPRNCTTQQLSDTTASALCTSGGGYYKATLICISYITSQVVTAEAPTWVRPGGARFSHVSCPYMAFVYRVGILSKAG